MFKKVISIFSIVSVLGLNAIPAFSAEVANTEHLSIHKKAPCNIVRITSANKTVESGNVLQFVYDEKYFSKCAKEGTIVHFAVPEAIYTDEGTLLFPKDTKIIAEVIRVENPKWFNKNARVSLLFKNILLPDNTCIDIKAKPFTKDYKVKEGPWTTTGKLVASTLTMGIIGAGIGVGFSFIPTPAKIGTGLAAGIPAGCGIGLVLGLVTPGCHYKAKKGEKIYAVLLEDVSVCNK